MLLTLTSGFLCSTAVFLPTSIITRVYFGGLSLAEAKIEREVFHCLLGIFTILGGGSIREYHNCNSWRLEVLCLMYNFYPFYPCF